VGARLNSRLYVGTYVGTIRVTLSARKVETAPPGRHVDGRGLMLVVKPSGARSWVLRYQLNGRCRDMGIGPYPEVTLAKAREKALEARRHLVEGVDPLTLMARLGLMPSAGRCPELGDNRKRRCDAPKARS